MDERRRFVARLPLFSAAHRIPRFLDDICLRRKQLCGRCGQFMPPAAHMKLVFHKGLLVAITLIFSQVCFATVTERTDKTGPGDDGIEVIAGTTYGHTLFDSAENKCQHCHSDLHDTWKTSMMIR